MTDKEAKLLKPGALIISIETGTVAIVSSVGRDARMSGKPLAIFESKQSLSLRPQSWRRASKEEIDIIYQRAIKALEDK